MTTDPQYAQGGIFPAGTTIDNGPDDREWLIPLDPTRPRMRAVDLLAPDLRAEHAALRARAESAEARYDRTRRELAELRERARVVDITQLDDAGTRTLCNTCGHQQFTPARPPNAPLPAEPATVEGQDSRDSEGASGGAA